MFWKILLGIYLFVANGVIAVMILIILDGANKFKIKYPNFVAPEKNRLDECIEWVKIVMRLLFIAFAPALNVVMFITYIVEWDTVVEMAINSVEEKFGLSEE